MTDSCATPDSGHSQTLLLVEDNPGDARLIEEAFSPALADRLRVVSTGDEALDFVNQRGEYVDAQRPDLILLDWHLPGIDGGTVLAELNSDSNHRRIPVIVLTGSQSEQEVRDAYAKNANACITKTAEPDELEATLRVFENFWLSTVRLPPPANEV
ncbi:response regulator [Haloterrigena salinisoli]|uniref:response regulator n=1 Tax=Haloterrigena salinisoli TaxID=3132747 RepID=UPI0030CE28A0